ncbi:MAG: DEAD/DEAH box helicase [Nitriliruptorales bacterium]
MIGAHPEPSPGGEAERFARGFAFPLDDFQTRALTALEGGRSVLVAAPTGAGKTVVGEFACHLGLAVGRKCFYTTPIKALSHQKFRDLAERHGSEAVGLLTGDRTINGDAGMVVMTTEVLRNMIYEGSSTLRDLGYVVLDEVHYLADPSRGAVWEEVIIQLPATVQLAALSATVSNAEEFGEWLSEVRAGRTEVIIEERRPVPLRHHYFVNDKIHPTFVSAKKGRQGKGHRERAAQALAGVPNPQVLMLERRAEQRGRGRGRRPPGTRLRWPDRAQVVAELLHRKWLPAILFVFSRNGCEQAVEQMLRSGARLTNADERRRVRDIVDDAVAGIPDEDLVALDFDAWLDLLERGVAAHHAGLVPAFKEAIERAFQSGLLKIVVATETLALGINMPAKSVVIERLEKWDGERHILLTPGQYTQLTGRAGRRGIDPIGHAVVLYQRDIDFRTVSGLVGTRTYPLSSSFSPSYNMAVNLLRRHPLAEAEALLTASFAQFQTDRSLGGLTRRLQELEEGMAGYADHLECDHGDWEGYCSLRRALSALEKREAAARRSEREEAIRERLAALVPGEVVLWPGGPRRGFAAVVGTSLTSRGTVLARVVTEDRRLRRLGPRELDAPPHVVGSVDLPERGAPRQPVYRAQVAEHLRELPDADPDEVPDGGRPGPSEGARQLREDLRRHPCHGCPERDEHERWQYRYDELHHEAQRLEGEVERRAGSLVRQLHRILNVLGELGYVDATPAPTEAGMRLARIYADADLVVAECLRRGVADELDPAELAGFCACFTFESRTDEPPVMPDLPSRRLAEAIGVAEEVAASLRSRERVAGLRPLRDLDPGFVLPALRWARGADLDGSLGPVDMTGGDFVRSMKRVADLAGQLRDAGGPAVAAAAATAVDALRRGIVAT